MHILLVLFPNAHWLIHTDSRHTFALGISHQLCARLLRGSTARRYTHIKIIEYKVDGSPAQYYQ